MTTPAGAERIAPCPWCGDAKPDTVIVVGGGEEGIAVRCVNKACAARGPSCDDDETAIAAWNRLAPSAPRAEREPAVIAAALAWARIADSPADFIMGQRTSQHLYDAVKALRGGVGEPGLAANPEPPVPAADAVSPKEVMPNDRDSSDHAVTGDAHPNNAGVVLATTIRDAYRSGLRRAAEIANEWAHSETCTPPYPCEHKRTADEIAFAIAREADAAEWGKAVKQRGMVGLMVYKMALDGSRGGFGGALKMLSSTESIRDAAVAAKQWCSEAVAAVRNADDPNPWRDSTDDEIADEILRQVAAKKSTEVKP